MESGGEGLDIEVVVGAVIRDSAVIMVAVGCGIWLEDEGWIVRLLKLDSTIRLST